MLKSIQAYVNPRTDATVSGPCTVFSNLIGDLDNVPTTHHTLERFAQDDVWNITFLENVILAITDHSELPHPVLHLLKAKGAKNVYITSARLQEGPYWAVHGSVHKVYRLYPDTTEAFITSTIRSVITANS